MWYIGVCGGRVWWACKSVVRSVHVVVHACIGVRTYIL